MLLLNIIAKQRWINSKQEPVVEKVRYFLLNLVATPVTSSNLEDAGSFEELGKKMAEQSKKTPLLLFFHLTENLMFVAPMLLTCLTISERHRRLGQSVGVLPFEVNSYRYSWLQLQVTLANILVYFPLQWLAFWLYTDRFPLWADAVKLDRAERLKVN